MTRVTSTNPATGEVLELDVHESTREEVLATTRRAGEAAPKLATWPPLDRAALLAAMAEQLESDAERLVGVADRETALGATRLHGELRRTAYQLRFFAEVVAEGAYLGASVDHATDSPMGPLPDLRRVNAPVGPVAVFGSSNFPFAFSVPGGDTASALAAGCAVVIKAHPAHPATSEACFRALERGAAQSGAPSGTLGLVFGLDAGVTLIDATEITAVGFTGSVAAGTALWRRALARPIPIPFYGELGSANPLVVSPRAAAERAREIGSGIASSMTLGSGQFCTKPGLAFVPAGPDGDALVAALSDALAAVGPSTMLSGAIAEHFRIGVRTIGAASGSRPLVEHDLGGGTETSPQLFEVDASHFARPDAGALRAECFGPLAVVVRYGDVAELGAALGASEPSLTFSAFLGEPDPDGQWLVELGARRAGRVIVNGYPTGVGVTWSMQHGGPWPATTASWATSVGAASIERWLRPVAYQATPDALLPPALQESNPLDLPRRVDGIAQRVRGR